MLIFISEVVISSIFIPASITASNSEATTPGLVSSPAPITDIFEKPSLAAIAFASISLPFMLRVSMTVFKSFVLTVKSISPFF